MPKLSGDRAGRPTVSTARSIGGSAPVSVSFDSNAWEKIFDPGDRDCAPIRAALADGQLKGFICESGFRIEAIRKRERENYFAQPHSAWRDHGIVTRDGKQYFHTSIGPADELHPGLPPEQIPKLQAALATGFKLMRGLAWMGLPAPPEIRDPLLFVAETTEARREREQRQLDVAFLIESRGIGRAAFDAAGGWANNLGDPPDRNRLRKACAEWADGELVSAHTAYQHDVLCTNDFARAAGASIFDAANRAWVTAEFGVVLLTLDELATKVAAGAPCSARLRRDPDV
jgi:hypothetical protein